MNVYLDRMLDDYFNKIADAFQTKNADASISYEDARKYVEREFGAFLISEFLQFLHRQDNFEFMKKRQETK